uniref:Uncharacterized protein n=1 Tax=Candidatus Kentrum eta TaxID=2126337 RepID=A0A450VCZ2_9GAMM|nr:MAG: hypothetical protein BECKH772A_GA0070896_101005 [Candidatus Kentron sp. H]VFJ96981.1 MAG: hypothetical protein BECKH772B_GA0070898_101025 [Candidatus Kentron sp. H]VFK02656.1 MAG: hypothetical protein BECKH772C_GA0070978_100985 [Candidatus Kentron sp. H]
MCEESALDAKHLIRERFTEIAASRAGAVIGAWEKYERQAGGTIEVLQAIMIKAMIAEIKDDLPIVDRDADCVPSGNDCAPSEKSWWIEVEATAVIPRNSLEEAVDKLYKEVTKNEEEKRKLMEEVTELRGSSRKNQKRIEQLENEQRSLKAQNKTLSAENERLLAELKCEKRGAEEKSTDLLDWYDLQRRLQDPETNNLTSSEEVEQRMKDLCESKSSLVRDRCRKYQTEKAAKEKEVAHFVRWAKEMGEKIDPWNRQSNKPRRR